MSLFRHLSKLFFSCLLSSVLLSLSGCKSEQSISGTNTNITNPPTILTQPVARVVPLGQSWQLSVSAVGEGTLHYQWRRNNFAISGAINSSYSFTPTTQSDGGNFDVVVSNEAGNITSNAVQIIVANTQGPWNAGLILCSSSNGSAWSNFRTIVNQGGVPCLARTISGRIAAVFQWFPFDKPEAFDKVAVSFSDNYGISWSSPQTIQLQNVPSNYMRPFDPTIVVLDDGRYRLYFTSNTGQGSANGFYSAISSDGVNYTWESGARFAPSGGSVDCAVTIFNGQFHLTSPIGAPNQGAYHAVSDDGLTFSRLTDIPSSGNCNWTGNLITIGTMMRFYGTSPTGIWFSESTNGSTWTQPISTGVQGGDPGIAMIPGGGWLMLYVGQAQN
ncbi:MAG: hypothetical protein FJ122_07570 [Deltaproteobacteria bacterium]|nr:hypothetical protein [Deltaproteobacteria bacterium]